jgi:UDP:flavonoid glycosyltransferase YjiC (YdhE family)
VNTVLFAWELGHGLGHLMNIRRIASRLKPHGVRIVAALKDTSSSDVLRPLVDEFVEAPAWPLDLWSRSRRPAATSATLNDVLSGAGLADGAAVRRLLAAWDDIFSKSAPDLVIADFSPLASLAARDRIPLVLIGNGYTLPPYEMRRFPPLHRHSPPAWSEPQTLDTVNGAARTLGRKLLTHLPQLFLGDAHLVQTFPLLDPYHAQRREFADSPVFDYEPTPRNAGADTVFVYLSAGYEPHPSIFQALQPLARRLRIYAPGIPMTQQRSLRALGARIDIEPPRLLDVLPSTRLVVHGGGSGVAAEALAFGVPQIVLSTHIEHDLNGEALESAGVAKFVRTYAPEAAISSALIKSAAEDTALSHRATKLGEWHRNHLECSNALLKCEHTCLLILE